MTEIWSNLENKEQVTVRTRGVEVVVVEEVVVVVVVVVEEEENGCGRGPSRTPISIPLSPHIPSPLTPSPMEQTCSIHSLELCSHSPSRGCKSCPNSTSPGKTPETLVYVSSNSRSVKRRLTFHEHDGRDGTSRPVGTKFYVFPSGGEKGEGRVSQSGLQYRCQQITGLDRGPKDQRTEFHADGETFL
ncbi:unnamed protein product [Arctogadus glacialis]